MHHANRILLYVDARIVIVVVGAVPGEQTRAREIFLAIFNVFHNIQNNMYIYIYNAGTWIRLSGVCMCWIYPSTPDRLQEFYYIACTLYDTAFFYNNIIICFNQR